MRFDQLQLADLLLQNVAAEGYDTATPIQAQAIPEVLAGRDVLGSAQTGTGKTAAFALPVLDRLIRTTRPTRKRPKAKKPRKAQGKGKPGHSPRPDTRARCLVLCPTRELATQITEGFATYAKGSGLLGVTVYGGVSQNPQVRSLRRGVDVIIATPGRLMDLMNQGHADLSAIETLVLDEADRMLDMGFIPDIRKIVAALPQPGQGQRQTLMFSATMPPAIRGLADELLHNPVRIEIAAELPTADRVEQSVYFVDPAEKPDLLAALIEGTPVRDVLSSHSGGMYRTIVFTRTKHGADKLVRKLKDRGIKAEAIHGNKTQNARQRSLQRFRDDKVAVLIATDVAARGIDVDQVSHVVNYDLTHEPETYVHRIGRTARAGNAGHAISFCSKPELAWLHGIERLLGTELDPANPVPAWARQSPQPAESPARRSKGRGGPPRREQSPRSPNTNKPRARKPRRGSGKPAAKASNASNSAPSNASARPSKKGKHRKGRRAVQ